MPSKIPKPTIGGKVPPGLYLRVKRITDARGLSIQRWLLGMLEVWVPAEEKALGLPRRRSGQRRPLRELPPPPADPTPQRPATPQGGPAAVDA